MKLTLTLLVTLLGVGLSKKTEGGGVLWDPLQALHDSSFATAVREKVHPAEVYVQPCKVTEVQDSTSTAPVAAAQHEDSTTKVAEAITDTAASHADSKSAEDKAETEGKAAEESIFSEQEQAMFREETNVFFDKAEELAREVMGEDLVKEAQALEAISDKDFTAEHEQKFRKVMQEMIEKFSTPEALEEIQKFADQPEVRAEVQKIGEAVEQAAVMAVEEMMLLSELERAMFFEDALYMDPQAMFNEPVVFMEFFEIPESYGASITLPKNIEELEKKFDGNLFKALELHESEFDDAKDEVVKAQQLRQPLMDQDADEVFEYLNTDNHAEIYHGYQVSKGSMKRPRRPEQPTEAEPDVTSN